MCFALFCFRCHGDGSGSFLCLRRQLRVCRAPGRGAGSDGLVSVWFPASFCRPGSLLGLHALGVPGCMGALTLLAKWPVGPLPAWCPRWVPILQPCVWHPRDREPRPALGQGCRCLQAAHPSEWMGVTCFGDPSPPSHVRRQQRAAVQSAVLHWQWHVVSCWTSQEPQA